MFWWESKVTKRSSAHILSKNFDNMRKPGVWRELFKVIKVITIVMTFATMVPSISAYKCPKECHCVKRRVSCEHQKLQEVPEGIPEDTLYLYIGWNQITEIKSSSFSSLVNLETLSLKKNSIFKIEDGAFSKTKLKTIFLTVNLLHYISAEAFAGLTSLEQLYLTDTRLTAIPDLRYATSLKKLNLDTNQIGNAMFPTGYTNLHQLGQVILTDNPDIKEITKESFQNLCNSSITKISLGRCSITNMAPGSFSCLSSLQSLSIGYNKISIKEIDGFIQGLEGSQIHYLDMSGVFQRLSHLPNGTFSVMNGVPLFQLRLAHSDITALANGCFEGLSKLTLLDLSYVKIAAIEPDAFAGLSSLKELKLNHNRLITIPGNLPPSLEKLDISNNPNIAELPNESFITLNKLKELRINNCGIVQVHSDALVGAWNLLVLDLSYNQMGGNNIGDSVMQKLHKLQELYLQGNILRTINKQTKLFEGLNSLILLDMSNSQCGTLSDGLFHPLKNLRVLKLQKNLLGNQLSGDTDGSTFEGLLNLRELYLESNEVNSLPAALFKDLHMLEKLVLKSNQIYHWESELFQPIGRVNLTVDLSMNQISVINETSLQYVRPSMLLNLSSNPFNCGCDLVWFRNWISGNNKTLLNLTSYTCKSPAIMTGVNLVDFVPEGIWTSCHWLEILYACIGLVFLITAVTSGVIYRYRWKILVHYYFARHYFRLHKRAPQTETDGDRNCLVTETAEYDAILSCDDEDYQFVENFLLTNIAMDFEENIQGATHRICYPKRDIEWGQHTSKFADMAQPANSSKMIVVLSESYMQTLCKADFELGVARHRLKEEGKQILIIIFMGTPELEAKAPADIKMLLNDEQCVVWEPKWQENPERYRDAIQVFYEQVKDLLKKKIEPFPLNINA